MCEGRLELICETIRFIELTVDACLWSWFSIKSIVRSSLFDLEVSGEVSLINLRPCSRLLSLGCSGDLCCTRALAITIPKKNFNNLVCSRKYT